MPTTLSQYYEYLKRSKRSIALTLLIFIFLGIIYILNAQPQYLVSIAINQKTEQQENMSSNSLVSLALGGSSQSGSKFYHEVFEVMFSMDVTAKFEENHGGLTDFFGDLYNESLKTYDPLWNLSTILQKIKFTLLGVPYNPIPNLYFLNEVIRGSINIRYDEYADMIYISSFTSSPLIIEKLINGIIIETDNSMKRSEKDELEERINFLLEELSMTSSIEQSKALSGILENQLLKKSLINTNSLYKILIVRGLETSEYPVKPNIFFLLALFTIFGFFLSIAFHTTKFITNEMHLE